MKLLKRSCTMLLTVGVMALALTACGSNEEATNVETEATTTVETEVTTAVETEETTAVETEETTAVETEEETTAVETEEETTAVETEEITDDEALSDATTITEDEAINLVKAEMGEDFSYIPADELEEKDGSQYYVIYVKMLLDEGNMTTVATYMVKTDGSVLFDKDAVNYTGEYVRTGDIAEVTFVVSEDGTFEMITSGEVNQVVSGLYKLGITDSASVIELLLYPNKNVTDGKEEVVENVEGTAVIEGDKLTLRMECEDTVFTKK